MNDKFVQRLLSIGIALSKEKDTDAILELILTTAMDITACDGGTLYIVDNNVLNFKLMITRSQNVYAGGRHGLITLPPVTLKPQNVCARSVLDNMMINIDDVYKSDSFDFSGPRKYDALTGYKTSSMLVIPMEDDKGTIIGVLQLINSLDSDGKIIPFDKSFELIISSLASQTAIRLTNINYAAKMQGMLDSFVKVMSTAIDARTPYNLNHTKNMVVYGQNFLDWLDKYKSEYALAENEKKAFIMSVWLHDVGKLIIPNEVMNKESRLGNRLEDILKRFRLIKQLDKVRMLEGKIDEDEYKKRVNCLNDTAQFIEKINKIGFLTDEMLLRVNELSTYTYIDEDSNECPLFMEDEIENLSIRKGTLTDKERSIMEGHVTMTSKLLNEMNFFDNYAVVPTWAGEHHEFLNGKGYPNGISADMIPWEVRLLTILDIFDALTAKDRPYKPPMTIENAFNILKRMAGDGQIDGKILALFEQSRAWD